MTQKLKIDQEFFEQAKKFLITKENRQKAADEAKILGTAMQQLLPEIFEGKRAIPNCFLRGALFGMVRKGRRALVGDMPIFSMSQYDLTFTGYELDQNDLEVWDTLIFLAKDRDIDNELKISLYELCQIMKLSDQKINRENLLNRAKRLALGKISIKHNSKEYYGSLIDDVYIDSNGDGRLVIRYNKKLAPLFTDDFTYVSADIKHLLGDNQLARWIYNFYESHREPLPFALNFIQKLCRSESAPKEFKRLLKTALEMVKQAQLVANLKSKWCYEITNQEYLLIYPKGKTKKQVELFNKF